MAFEQRKSALAVFILVVSLHFSEADLPVVFIFGDSTMDVGTNNYIHGNATANTRFYGIDYPYSKPTGRFSNGYNTADFIVRLLGVSYQSPPPYLSLARDQASFKSKILKGVNFASGGSGILEGTGFQTFIEVVPLKKQIEQFAIVRENIVEVLGHAKGEHLLSNALYLISAGSNDFFDHELQDPFKPATELIEYLQGNYTNHLKNLYNLGARKFAVVGVPAIGCIPAIRAKVGGSCLDDLNNISRVFNNRTEKLLDNFSSSFKGVNYSLGNTYAMTMSIIDNARTNGFKNVKKACCGTGSFNGADKCRETSDLCMNRNEYLFWDYFHPTQTASKLAALTLLFAEGKEYVTPINFSHLARIKV